MRAPGQRAEIEWPVGLHALRHSCASIMFRRGVSKEAIRKMLGHHPWDFTVSTYLHLNDGDLPVTDFLDEIDGHARSRADEDSQVADAAQSHEPSANVSQTAAGDAKLLR